MQGMNETAFPIIHADGQGVQYFGLSKLEYGALEIAAAMCTTGSGGAWPSASDRHEIARRSVLIASAVLTEANK